jgi:hypothetical protein
MLTIAAGDSPAAITRRRAFTAAAAEYASALSGTGALAGFFFGFAPARSAVILGGSLTITGTALTLFSIITGLLVSAAGIRSTAVGYGGVVITAALAGLIWPARPGPARGEALKA